MRRIAMSIAAAGVLVAGAFVASTLTNGQATALTGDAQQTDFRFGDGAGAVLEDVLGDLVEAGTLTSDQAVAVKEAMLAKREEIRAEREALREAHEAIREQIRGFLEDDVIDADELSQLPEDHVLRDEDGPFADALEDGEITRAELQEVRIRRHFRRHH